MVAVPLDTAVTTPVLETVATAELEDNQTRFWFVALSGEIAGDMA